MTAFLANAFDVLLGFWAGSIFGASVCGLRELVRIRGAVERMERGSGGATNGFR